MNRRLVVDDGRTARELLLVGTMVVGRDPECEISHRDPRLSRRHAEFSIGEHGVTVRDLDSRNGIRVNGRVVKEALLQAGDLVQIAQLSVRFVDDEATAPPGTLGGAPASTVTIAAGAEDDRTRIAASGAFSAALAHVAVAASVGARPAAQVPSDDRTRVAASPVQSGASFATPAIRRAPVTDIADLVFRDPTSPESPAIHEPDGVGSLARVGWGRRVLLQGLMLALVVFLMATVPLLIWQRQTFGATAAQSLAVLLPPLLASGAAGILVAALIARTAARGVQTGRSPRR